MPQLKKWYIQKKRRRLLPAADILCVDQIDVDHLHSPIPDVVHLLHPKHLILSLELFGDALTLGHLLYQLKKHSFCLLVQIGKITVQLAGDLQRCVHRLTVLPEIPQMPLKNKCQWAFVLQRTASNMECNNRFAARTKARSSRRKCTFP